MYPNGVRTAGVLGAGTVQLAAQTRHQVIVCDNSVEALG